MRERVLRYLPQSSILTDLERVRFLWNRRVSTLVEALRWTPVMNTGVTMGEADHSVET